MPEDNLEPNTQRIYQQIREVLIQARVRALQALNTELVFAIGRLIVEEEQQQQGEIRAAYGKGLIRLNHSSPLLRLIAHSANLIM